MDKSCEEKSYFRLFVYEFLGTCILASAVCMKPTETWTVPLAVFGANCLCWRKTGGHYNPALTTAISWRDSNGKERGLLWGNLYFWAQILGALFGVMLAKAAGFGVPYLGVN